MGCPALEGLFFEREDEGHDNLFPPVVLQGCEIGWNWLDTSSKRGVCEVSRDLQLHGELDFGTAEILCLVRILDDSEGNQQNFDSIGGL